MEYVKKTAPYLDMVLRGILFMGFSVQIVLGICWICGNFGQVQGFGEPDSRLHCCAFWARSLGRHIPCSWPPPFLPDIFLCRNCSRRREDLPPGGGWRF